MASHQLVAFNKWEKNRSRAVWFPVDTREIETNGVLAETRSHRPRAVRGKGRDMHRLQSAIASGLTRT
jgi:hypothetical protein